VLATDPSSSSSDSETKVNDEDKALLGDDDLDSDVADDLFDHQPGVTATLQPGSTDHGSSCLRALISEAVDISRVGLPDDLMRGLPFVLSKGLQRTCIPNMHLKVGTCAFSVLKNKPCSHWIAMFIANMDVASGMSDDELARSIWVLMRSHMPSIPPAVDRRQLMVPDQPPMSMQQNQLPAHAEYPLDEQLLNRVSRNGVAQLLKTLDAPAPVPIHRGGRPAKQTAHKGGWRAESQGAQSSRPITPAVCMIDPYSPLEGIEAPKRQGGRKIRKAAYRAEGLASVFNNCVEQVAVLVQQAEKAALPKKQKPTPPHNQPQQTSDRALFGKIMQKDGVPCKRCWAVGESFWFHTQKAMTTHFKTHHPDFVSAIGK
jgi:hypothetical protein